MRKAWWALCAVFVLTWCVAGCNKPDKAQVAAHTAKCYYDYLLEGKYSDFVAGLYHDGEISGTYRSQLEANAKMFIAQLNTWRSGLVAVDIDSASADNDARSADVYLIFHYGDSTRERVLVPMVEKDGLWLMR
jgi:hypothetical protein